jgi:SAM-dependent methyltransferase
LSFFIDNIKIEEFKGKRVLEVGSKYVNGSVRPLIERFCSPREYVGVDIEAEKLVEYFGPESFDVVISTETLEHVQNWRLVINNMKSVLKCGGYISQLVHMVSHIMHILMIFGDMRLRI